MLTTADRLESFIRATGRLIAWLTLLMVIVTCIVVVQRYLFDTGSIRLQESITFMHAAVFLLTAAYTLSVDAHVRVDIFYSRMNARNQALVNLSGTLLMLMPFCGFLIWSSWDFVSMSWSVREASPESGGLPYPFPAVMKSFIPIAATLLVLQGIAIMLRAVAALSSREQ
jgi:TRAP-type mannitol/chloroaromatic compound transport system permease small subunit